jgi:hypothetical protein
MQMCYLLNGYLTPDSIERRSSFTFIFLETFNLRLTSVKGSNGKGFERLFDKISSESLKTFRDWQATGEAMNFKTRRMISHKLLHSEAVENTFNLLRNTINGLFRGNIKPNAIYVKTTYWFNVLTNEEYLSSKKKTNRNKQINNETRKKASNCSCFKC